MLHFHRSNRLESLADALAAVIARPAGDALEAETVVVQTRGMARWLHLALAERNGAAMNLLCPFPQLFLGSVFNEAFGESYRAAAWSPDVLGWRIAAVLPGLLARREFAVLSRFTKDGTDALALWQLAQRIATVFDRSIAHRPQIVAAWSRGETGPGCEPWLAQLWRAVADGHPEHPVALLDRLPEKTGLRRVCIFGLSSLPQLHLALFDRLARTADVHLFLLEATPEFWADTRSFREQARDVRRGQRESEHFPTGGNPLLASLGKLARTFTERLLDFDSGTDDDRFIAPAETSLLRAVQSDVFHLRDPLAAEVGDGWKDDGSIAVHACHSLARQLEVLHDQILARLDADPTLEPRDFVVMMPDIEAAAPLIEGIFGAPETDAVRIPYSVADRRAPAAATATSGLLHLLALLPGRLGASEVFALLELPLVAAHFGLDEAGLAMIREWITRTGIRWGRDAAHRVALDLPAYGENTWRAGLDRLLLGYALGGDGTTLFAGRLAEPSASTSTAAELDALLAFNAVLDRATTELAQPRPLDEWARWLRELARAFFDAPGEEILNLCVELEKLPEASGHHAAVEFRVFRAEVERRLGGGGTGGPLLAGGVTFCALQPMRSLPFRVVCLLGMEDGAFPRQDVPLPFDPPSPPAPTRRDEDRQLFLEAILSARDALYLSYNGQSLRDDSDLPPSVVVAELLDYLRLRGTALTPLRHRLHAHSRAYFSGGAHFSYSQENATARTHGGEQTTSAPFATAGSRAASSDTPEEIALEDLIAFYQHPSRWFLRRALRVELPWDESPLDDGELSALPNREQEKILQRIAESGAAAPVLAAAKAAGVLPAGNDGRLLAGELAAEGEQLASRWAEHRADDGREAFRIAAGRFTVSGVLPARLAILSPSDLRPKTLLRAWIEHLAWHSAHPGEAEVTPVVCRDETALLQPTPEPAELLDGLCRWFAEGQSAPLPFFPETSWAFTDKTDADAARDAAWKKWRGGRNISYCERDDAWNALAFRGIADPLDERFESLAVAILTPLREALKEPDEAKSAD